MYIHTEIKTYRHTQTNRQTDSAEVQEGRQKNIQMYSKTIAYLKIDRQTEQTRDFPAPFRPPSPPTHIGAYYTYLYHTARNN
jgi:hypothetical protein